TRLIIEIDTIEMVTGNFPQRFLDQFFSLAGIEFLLPLILVTNTCRVYLDLINLAAMLKVSIQNRQILPRLTQRRHSSGICKILWHRVIQLNGVRIFFLFLWKKRLK